MNGQSILNQYVNGLMKLERVTPEEEKALARQIQQGDQKAKEKLIQANLRLVVKIAMEYSRHSDQVMDVIQNGNMGLIRAVEHYDPERGVKLSTYAAYWIRQAILRGFIKPNASLSISYRKDEINKRVKKYIEARYHESGKLPSAEQVAADLGVQKKDALDVLKLYKNSSDLSIRPAVENSEDLIDNFPDSRYNPEMVVETEMMESNISDILSKLDERENHIIRNRFGFNGGENLTLQALGDRYQISAEAARQIERRVLHKIRRQYSELETYCA